MYVCEKASNETRPNTENSTIAGFSYRVVLSEEKNEIERMLRHHSIAEEAVRHFFHYTHNVFLVYN